MLNSLRAGKKHLLILLLMRGRQVGVIVDLVNHQSHLRPPLTPPHLSTFAQGDLELYRIGHEEGNLLVMSLISNSSPQNITITSDEEARLLKKLEKKTESESLRIKRFLDYADLSRIKGSPLFELAKRIVEMEKFKNFDNIRVPEIVEAGISFDLFNFPTDHPARSRSDTYY